MNTVLSWMSGKDLTPAEQKRLLIKKLKKGPLTSYDAKIKYNITDPVSRVRELRRTGHNISSKWVTRRTTGMSTQRMAEYVLH